MATAAQIRANRANAQLSTGPRTPQGKQRSSQNARRHGFRSSKPSPPPFDDPAFQRLLQNYQKDYHPSTLAESLPVATLAHADLRLQRLSDLDRALWSAPLTLGQFPKFLSRAGTYLRHRGAIKRTLYQAIHTLDTIRA